MHGAGLSLHEACSDQKSASISILTAPNDNDDSFHTTGISRDSRHKRRHTGGKRAAYRKKRKFELGASCRHGWPVGLE